jgi:hypothetical protein
LPDPFLLLFRRSSLMDRKPVYSEIGSFLSGVLPSVAIVHLSLEI